ncbi:MAG: hypothetical protein E7053_09010 [Lentisphaerae bacterium]|nr:hypothetical protein [Lentisphaerota bacterium]
MKKILSVTAAIFTLILSAVDLPRSVTVKSGNVTIRLDAAKRCFINRIEYNGRLFGLDNRGAHYGSVFSVKGESGMAGSGHTEAGYGEEVIFLQMMIDGRIVDYSTETALTGKYFFLHKISKVGHFTINYTLQIANDVIDERSTITSDADVQLNCLYNFMHPWALRFTEYYAVMHDGNPRQAAFQTNGKFPIYSPAPSLIAIYDPETGDGVVTTVQPGSGQNQLKRYLWDTRYYRKGYFVDFTNKTFPAGHVAVYQARTTFFNEPDKAKWVEAAENAAK